ncbi:hypothetical protein BDP81DRAFT_420012 [Colletotrichum phormii]|uniref:Uncharacterized protein n=1 Tax=Colletotrichum phormii TaxID=359342 RepID=A0AAJ0EKV6_9PEZI|nr:uncharacterized protein BDP81DRAFT_420012 [Colletotrichum phormii]KAK1640421.1 hypothetical protein BDP81DRAFT_420012 [Colletotrichum phormii]
MVRMLRIPEAWRGGFHRRADHQNSPQACIARPPWSHEISRICGGPISGHFGQPMAALAVPRGSQSISGEVDETERESERDLGGTPMTLGELP